MRTPSSDAHGLAGELLALARAEFGPAGVDAVKRVLRPYTGLRTYISKSALDTSEKPRDFASRLTRSGMGRETVAVHLQGRGVSARHARRLAAEAAAKFGQRMAVPPVTVRAHEHADPDPGPRR